jgi:hypothetical protein
VCLYRRLSAGTKNAIERNLLSRTNVHQLDPSQIRRSAAVYALHMLNRSFRRFIAFAALCLMLAGQWGLAAHACDRMANVTMHAPCAEAMDCESSMHESNLCMKHCQDEPQNAGDVSPQAGVAVAPLSVAMLPTAPAGVDSTEPATPALARATAPPLTIRHCCWRI